MPLFSGLSWLRRREAPSSPKEVTKKDDHTKDFTDLENDFFAQGEETSEMKKPSEERLSELFLKEQERKQGKMERGFFERSEVVNLTNVLKRTGSLDSVSQPPEVKIAFLRNMADQLKAKQKALATSKQVSLKETASLHQEIQQLENLQVKYGMEIDFNGGPDDGEELSLNETEDDETEEEGEEKEEKKKEEPLAA